MSIIVLAARQSRNPTCGLGHQLASGGITTLGDSHGNGMYSSPAHNPNKVVAAMLVTEKDGPLLPSPLRDHNNPQFGGVIKVP